MTHPDKKIQGASVQVHTWDTKHGASGMSGFAHAQAKGLNVGHAAMEVTFPATQEGIELIKKYCLDGNKKALPYERHSQMVQTGVDDAGKPQFSEKDVFTVYFSWWPDEDKHADLRGDINTDNKFERPGANYGQGPVNPDFADVNLEQRTYSGPLGSERVTLAPHQVVHERAGGNTPENNYLKAQHAEEQVNQKNVQIKLLAKKLEKIDKDKKSTNTRGTVNKLLDKYCEGWKEKVDNEHRITPDEAKKLLDELVNPAKAQIEQELNEARAETNDYKVEIEQAHEAKLDDKVNTLKESLALLPKDAHSAHIEAVRKSDPGTVARFERDAITEKHFAHQSVKMFVQFTDFEDDDKFQQVKDFLFDGIDPPLDDNGSHKYGNDEAVRSIKENWRKFLPDDQKNIAKEDFTREMLKEAGQRAGASLQELFDQRAQKTEEYINLYYTQPPVLSSIKQDFVTAGLMPDNQVNLPVGGLNKNESQKPGLNIEPMLEKMRDLRDNTDKKFSLATRNCSDTVGKILEAGAVDSDMKKVINPKNIGGGFGTPQAVLNGAQNAQEAYLKREGELNKRQKVSANSPTKAITRASGWLLRNTLNKNKNPIVRALSGAGLVLMSPVTALAAAINTVAGAISSRVGKSDKTQMDSVTPFNQNPAQGRDNAEISMGQNDGIESPKQAIEAFIEQSQQANVIPAFEPETMIAVSRYLTSDECDKNLYDNYMKAANDVMNKAQDAPQVEPSESLSNADPLERAEEDRFAELFEQDTSTFLPAREKQQSAQQQPQDAQKHQSDQKHRRHRSKSAGHDDHSSKPSSPERQRHQSNGHANAFTAMYQSHQKNQAKDVSPTLQQRVDEQQPQQPEPEKRSSSRRRGKSSG